MRYEFNTNGVCARKIAFDINDNIVTNISFTGGCNGNLKAVSILANGLTVDEIEAKCSGILCNVRSTSCADQLAKGVRQAYEQLNAK
ncbi:MAG: TIGR03905 family TSCPD domain-containing protein [Christensenellaceae bacterium]|nr:TIGR03905 family TSCPD domain-containing protein [Christensenellaceae bacterium]